MNTKTVKEKVEEIIRENIWGYECNVCGGGGSMDGNGKDICKECKGTGIHDWYLDLGIDKIDKLYRNEMLKELPKEKKILWPLNGCRKDCKICKIEVENWNSCLREAKKVLFYNK